MAPPMHAHAMMAQQQQHPSMAYGDLQVRQGWGQAQQQQQQHEGMAHGGLQVRGNATQLGSSWQQ